MLRNSHIFSSHSCIHDEIIHQRRRPGRKEYSVSPQNYKQHDSSRFSYAKGRTLLGVPPKVNTMKSIRIYLNYDAVGHSQDRDCRSVGDIVKVGNIYEQKPCSFNHPHINFL